MALDQKFQRDKRNRPNDLIIGVVASILLHGILFLGGNDWYRFVMPDLKREADEPIPIEFVEVPSKKATPPPETSRRAATDSVAGGKAKPELPVAARSAPPSAPQVASKIPTDSPAPQPPKLSPPQPKEPAKPASSSPPEPKKPAAASSDLPPQKPTLKTQTTAVAPSPRSAPSPAPQVASEIPVDSPAPQPAKLSPPEPKEPVAVSPKLPPLKEPAAASPKLPPLKVQPRPQTTAAVPATPEPKPLTRATPQTPSPPQQSQKLGAASRLGGPISISRNDFRGNYQAALPNSNRSNPGADGIDARRDVDFGPYMEQLRQRVRRQWIPGLSQSSRRTVLYFTVSRSGQVSSLQIIQTSGSSVTDKAALSAIKRAAPFAPLPTDYPRDYINIQFTFDINVYGNLDLRAR